MSRPIACVVAVLMALCMTLGLTPNATADTLDCRTIGDRVCAPGNDTGVTPGCYSATGELLAGWPCRVVSDPVTSTDHVYKGLADPLLPTRSLIGPAIAAPVPGLAGAS